MLQSARQSESCDANYKLAFLQGERAATLAQLFNRIGPTDLVTPPGPSQKQDKRSRTPSRRRKRRLLLFEIMAARIIEFPESTSLLTLTYASSS